LRKTKGRKRLARDKKRQRRVKKVKGGKKKKRLVTKKAKKKSELHKKGGGEKGGKEGGETRSPGELGAKEKGGTPETEAKKRGGEKFNSKKLGSVCKCGSKRKNKRMQKPAKQPEGGVYSAANLKKKKKYNK